MAEEITFDEWVEDNYRKIHAETGVPWETLAKDNIDPRVAAWMRSQAGEAKGPAKRRSKADAEAEES